MRPWCGLRLNDVGVGADATHGRQRTLSASNNDRHLYASQAICETMQDKDSRATKGSREADSKLSRNEAAVTDALRLRYWALGVLTGQEYRDPPEVSDVGSSLFFEAERCGVPLLRELTDKGHAGSLPVRIHERLSERAANESRRIQCVRDQLVEIGEIAHDRGFKVVVLKGATAVSSGGAVDLVDIDLLVDEAFARDFTAELDRRAPRAMLRS